MYEQDSLSALDAITEAMINNKCITLVYHSYWADAHTFTVEPYFVKFFKQRWYLIARNKIKDAIRIYALDRILALSQAAIV